MLHCGVNRRDPIYLESNSWAEKRWAACPQLTSRLGPPWGTRLWDHLPGDFKHQDGGLYFLFKDFFLKSGPFFKSLLNLIQYCFWFFSTWNLSSPTEPVLPALEVQSLNLWATREVAGLYFFMSLSILAHLLDFFVLYYFNFLIPFPSNRVSLFILKKYVKFLKYGKQLKY